MRCPPCSAGLSVCMCGSRECLANKADGDIPVLSIKTVGATAATMSAECRLLHKGRSHCVFLQCGLSPSIGEMIVYRANAR